MRLEKDVYDAIATSGLMDPDGYYFYNDSPSGETWALNVEAGGDRIAIYYYFNNNEIDMATLDSDKGPDIKALSFDYDHITGCEYI